MARLRLYLRSLVSGYAVLAVNIVYTLFSVPLALHFLSRREFEVWAFSSTVASYLALVDAGMTSAVGRVLVDCKDDRDGGEYGSLILSTIITSVVQALIVLVVAVAVALAAPAVIDVSADLVRSLRLIIIGQGAILSVGFVTRFSGLVLTAHQRVDVANYGQLLSFVVSFAAPWVFFRTGAGLLAMIYAQGLAICVIAVVTFLGCRQLQLFPRRGAWGRASWKQFCSVFSLSKDVFLFSVAYQLVTGSHLLVATKLVGIEAAALWSICTRTLLLVQQLIVRVMQFSGPALAEMIVRKERERLLRRFRSLVNLSSSLAVAAAVFFAVGNQPFVALWTNGKFHWPMHNDVMLGFWLVLVVITFTHMFFASQAKLFRLMRNIYFVEAILFVGLSWAFASHWGIGAVIVATIVGTLLCSLPAGAWLSSREFELPWSRVLFHWSMPALRVGLVLVPVGVAVHFLVRNWSPSAQFATVAAVGVTVTPWVVYGLGFDQTLQHDVRTALNRIVARIIGRSERISKTPTSAES